MNFKKSLHACSVNIIPTFYRNFPDLYFIKTYKLTQDNIK